jgi:hypothetical protein
MMTALDNALKRAVSYDRSLIPTTEVLKMLQSIASERMDREAIAALLYMTRFPHLTWLSASLAETALAYKQADAILAL